MFSNFNKVAPITKSLLVNGSHVCLRPTTMACYNTSASLKNRTSLMEAPQMLSIKASRLVNRMAVQPLHTASTSYNSSTKFGRAGSTCDEEQYPLSIAEILEREIKDESAELNQHLSTDQFPGFSVETDGSDVKLTKQVAGSTVTIRFTVSSSLNEWPTETPQTPEQGQQKGQEPEPVATNLMSMPEFQVQICKGNSTLELSCYFEEMEQDEETGEPYVCDPVFGIDELVMYQGEPKETEFSVSAEYFQEDLQAALLQYLAGHGIDDEFSKNLVGFATSYEKKQYIGLMKRLKSFVSK